MTDTPAAIREGEPLGDYALAKLVRVLGEPLGLRAFEAALAAAGLREIRSADDLYAFSEQLSRRGGYEAAVGGLLGVAAVLRGASAPPRSA